MKASKFKVSFLTTVVGFLFLFLMFALPSIHKPLVGDEVAFSVDSENPQFGLIEVWHPPLYFDILRFLVHHLGIEKEYLRFFGIACFLLTLFLIYFLSKNVTQNRKLGILACFLFATHPWAIQGSLILDIDNTILTVLLTFFIFYFIKTYNLFSPRHYLFSGLLFFLCLWTKLSTPLILLFSIFIFYILRGEFKKGIVYTFSTGAIGIGLFFLFWAIYSRSYNLDFFSIFERSLAILGRGPVGSSLSAFSEITLRFLRVSLWTGLYLVMLWLIIATLRIKGYFIHKKTVEIKDFFLIYTILIFIFYIFIGGTSFGFAKHQYPILPILSVIIADFILDLRLRISKRQWLFYVLFGLFFFAIERFCIGDLLYQMNYLLRKIAIFSPYNLKNFFLDFGWRVGFYPFVFILGIFLIWFIDRKEKILNISIMLLLILILSSNFSHNFRHLKADYFTTYCYGRDIKESKLLEKLFKDIILKDKKALIIGPEDVLFNAGYKGYTSEYCYNNLWNDRKKFLKAIEDKRVKCVSYSFTWNALFTHKEIFFHPQVQKSLRDKYHFFSLGDYSVWLRK